MELLAKDSGWENRTTSRTRRFSALKPRQHLESDRPGATVAGSFATLRVYSVKK